MLKRSTLGFTLIELIVVITVLCVIAGVSLLVYNTLSKRAENTQMVSAAEAYESALAVYYGTHKTYPATFDSSSWRSTGSIDLKADTACLGDEYPETDEFHEGACAAYSDHDSGTLNPSVEQALAAILRDAPQITPANVYHYEDIWLTRGLRYTSMSESGQYELAFSLRGDRDCGSAAKDTTVIEGEQYTHCTTAYRDGERAN